MNLVELQQKINNYTTVVSSWLKNVGKLYFSAKPEEVKVKLLDEDGNVVDSMLPNVAQFRKTVQDDINSTLSLQMYKAVYVDELKGDDENDGSNEFPFKTIHKAIASAPVGGYVRIILKSDITIDYDVGYQIGLCNQNVVIISDYPAGGDIPAVKRKLTLCYGYFNLGGLTYNSCAGFLPQGAVNMCFRDIDIVFKESTIRPVNPAKSWDSYSYLIKYSDSSTSHISFYLCNINLPKAKAHLIIAHPFSNLSMSLYSTKVINNNVGKLLVLGVYSCGTLALYNSSLSDGNWESVISGIVKDTNGVPRNLKSSLIL